VACVCSGGVKGLVPVSTLGKAMKELVLVIGRQEKLVLEGIINLLSWYENWRCKAGSARICFRQGQRIS